MSKRGPGGDSTSFGCFNVERCHRTGGGSADKADFQIEVIMPAGPFSMSASDFVL